MLERNVVRNAWQRVAMLAVGTLVCLPAVQAVTVDVDVTGNEKPNKRLTVTANVDIDDGSTIQGYEWSQVSGVQGNFTNDSAKSTKFKLGPRWRYESELFTVISEPPITEAQLPENVPVPDYEEFPGGLQNRWGVVAINPFSLEEAGHVRIMCEVTTSSGTYTGYADIHTELPWKVSTGLNNVPVGAPVILYGKEQAAYSWSMDTPGGSTAALDEPTTRSPIFTPDVGGRYDIHVMDMNAGQMIDLYVYAGEWRGVIVGQNADGRPIGDPNCTTCHNAFAEPNFEPWAETGHAEIFTNNLNTSTHYGENCFACHTVGYDPDNDLANGFAATEGFDDFLGAGMLNNPGDNWTQMLEDFPELAMKANIQCENCHGPQLQNEFMDSEAHSASLMAIGEPRTSLSADVCASCHGEPLRHARFQQWQLSAHANYELAFDEGESPNCSRCHTGNGFRAWLPVLLGEVEGDPLDDIQVTWEPDETHPQTCATCHDPHAIGTVSGDDSNATVFISGDTPDLIAGFKAVAAGKGAICMTCHNTRRGAKNDALWPEFEGTDEASRAPHGGAQADVLMGQNAFLTNVGVRGAHSFVENTCVNCHMQQTPPPDDLAYNQGGTNHTFYASVEICERCHTDARSSAVAETVQGETALQLELLNEELGAAWQETLEGYLGMGYTIDWNNTMITGVGQLGTVSWAEETRGRQALSVVLGGGTKIGATSLASIDVIMPGGTSSIAEIGPEALLKAGWNYNLINNDGSLGVHNPTFALTVLDAARDAVAAY